MGTCGRVVLGDVEKDSEKCAKNSQNGSVAMVKNGVASPHIDDLDVNTTDR